MTIPQGLTDIILTAQQKAKTEPLKELPQMIQIALDKGVVEL